MKIGLFADSHYSAAEVSCTTRRPSMSYGKIEAAMRAFGGCDLVVCLGDLADHGGDTVKNLSELSAMIRGFGVPFYSLMGNHDADVFTRGGFDALTGFLPPPVVRDGGNALVFLDANYRADGSAYVPGEVDWVDTFLPEAQLDVLRSVLADAAVENVYVFVHQNLDDGVERRHIISNAADVRAMLAASGKVRRVIQGHYHPGHDAVIDGIPYHTLPAMCEGERNWFEILEI